MDNLSIIPFGGVRENGKNMYAITVNDRIYILDAGLKYPETDQLGIDVVIPNFDYLVENADKVAGIFLTHGHADSIGAVPYLLQQVKAPVFGSDMTLALVQMACDAIDELKDFTDYHVVTPKSEIAFDGDGVVINFFNTSHTIPNSLGICLETPFGKIVYTGDFKFDQTAKDYYQTDIAQLVNVAKSQDVLAVLGDAAGTENPNDSVPEQEIEEYILSTFRENRKKRIIVAAVASNIQRIQQVINAACLTGRRIILSGNDIENVVRTAIKVKKIQLPKPQNELFVNIKRIDELQASETVVLETGRMGEPIKHLERMATHEDQYVHIGENDLVFITTTPSTALEGIVAKVRDALFKAGADVKQISNDLRSSGHASRKELQLMLNIFKPKYFMPVQGEYRVMKTAKEAANAIGLDDNHVLMAKIGDQYKYKDGEFILEDSLTIGETMIDGSGIGDIGNIVLRDRKILSEDGVFISVVTIDRKKRKVVSKPKLTSRGFVYVKANRDLMKEASAITVEQIENYLNKVKNFDWNDLKNSVREKLSKYLFEQTKRRPVIMPVVMEINQNRRPSRKSAKANVNKSGSKTVKATKRSTDKKVANKNNIKTKLNKTNKRNKNNFTPNAQNNKKKTNNTKKVVRIKKKTPQAKG